jgi:hypothetical protein
VRYFPSRWMALIRNEGGDGALPILREAMDYIDQDFPRLVQRLGSTSHASAAGMRSSMFRVYPDQSKFRRFAGGSNARNALAGPLMCDRTGASTARRGTVSHEPSQGLSAPHGLASGIRRAEETAREIFQGLAAFSNSSSERPGLHCAPNLAPSRRCAFLRARLFAVMGMPPVGFPRPLFPCIRRPSGLSRTRHCGVIPFASSPGSSAWT